MHFGQAQIKTSSSVLHHHAAVVVVRAPRRKYSPEHDVQASTTWTCTVHPTRTLRIMTHYVSASSFRPAFCLPAHDSVPQVGHNNRHAACNLPISFRIPVMSLPEQNTVSANPNALIYSFSGNAACLGRPSG